MARADEFGRIDINCDAPPYYIVQACKLPSIGFERPEDVRWLRVAYIHFGMTAVRCPCLALGPLVALCEVCFTLKDQPDVHYLMGQCPRCKTMYWRER